MLVDALGPLGVDGHGEHRVRIVEANIMTHFIGPSWDCVVGVYASEDDLPSARLAKLASVCSILRYKHFQWGDFLNLLTPTWVHGYDKVAVLLDDLGLPPQVNAIKRMLAEMDIHGIDVYSPAVNNSHYMSTKPSGEKCLKLTRCNEIFFTVFRTEAWQHVYARLIHESNHGGCGYDLCLHKACPDLRVAVDHRFVAKHYASKKTGNQCDWHSYADLCGRGDIRWTGSCVADLPAGRHRTGRQRISPLAGAKKPIKNIWPYLMANQNRKRPRRQAPVRGRDRIGSTESRSETGGNTGGVV